MRKEDFFAMAGRILLALIFLASAFGKVTNFSATTRYMEAHGVPLAPLFCALAALLEALGGISLILGYFTRWGAAALAGFTIAATIVFHTGPGSEQRIQLLKNLAILGGLLQVVAFGSGEISLEEKRIKR